MDGYDLLASPATGAPLVREPGGLRGSDGVLYPLAGGIADLVDARFSDALVTEESALFDSIPLAGLCYFRPGLFDSVIAELGPLLANRDNPSCAEIGGGEGWMVRAFVDAFPCATGFVCDVARRPLTLADPRLVRIRGDARRPYLQPGTLDVAVFWVSLHHFQAGDLARCLGEAVTALRPGGLLLLFEPSDHFLPRRLFYKMPLRHLVYFDEEEKGVNLVRLQSTTEALGLRRLSACGVNPPYSLAFLRHFRLWPLFWAVVEALYQLDRTILAPAWWRGEKNGGASLAAGSYVKALYRKDDRE